jgi:uncharacterized protein
MQAAITTAAEPDGSTRVASLDILRGLAILAILFMNIPFMGGSGFAAFEEIQRYGWTAADRTAWVVQHVLAEGTARGLLEMLFGVGMVILTDRAAQAGASRWGVWRGYTWRNIVLFLFGLVHVFVLLWPGDILHTYGVAALIAVLFRRLGPTWLLVIGLAFSLLMLAGGTYAYFDSIGTRAEVARIEAKQAAGTAISADDRTTLTKAAERKAKRDESAAETAAYIEREDRARSAATGTLQTWSGSLWESFLKLQGKGLEILFVWEALSTMLIGAALYKWGVIQGRRSPRFYVIAMVMSYVVGGVMRSYTGYERLMLDDQPQLGQGLYDLARLIMTFGHICLVHLMLDTARGRALLRPFEAAGKTALSVYIAQTLVTLWVLYPPFMLGWYGTQSWAMWMLVALVVNAGLLWGANLWVRRFEIAPVEWLWRSIVARRMLPFPRRTSRPGSSGVPVAA